jgi:superfamily II DNA or RNA helicase
MLAAHQREALARCRELLAQRGGAVLADDVGLGKSFVAAALARDVGDVDLIVPAALVEQWRATLRRFEVLARVLTHDGIVREPFLPRPGQRLVIVDEAHAFRNPRTQRYAALARRTIGAAVLLVTATPVCNSLSDLRALIDLFARDDLLADRGVPSIDLAFETGDPAALRAIVAELVIRRERSVVPPALQFGRLERHVIRHEVFEPARPLIDALRFPLVGEQALLRRFLWRRLESSEAALLESLRRQRRFYERALDCLASGRALPKPEYRRAFGREEDRDAFQQVLFWELFVPAGANGDAEEIRDEVRRLDDLRTCLERSPRAKRQQLVDLVTKTNEPMLIFTSAAATAQDLHAALGGGLVAARERSRDAVLRAFRDGRVDVVISTDVAAEGLDLQRAGVVVHYDIPWNPVKLDQRNGRAHRIGQRRASVEAIYFLPASRESRIIETIARKNRVRRRYVIPSEARDPGGREPDSVTPPSQVPRFARDNRSSLRPRLPKNAPALLFFEAAGRAGLEPPDTLLRRHRAGIELLLREMASEYLDQRRLDDLVALAGA